MEQIDPFLAIVGSRRDKLKQCLPTLFYFVMGSSCEEMVERLIKSVSESIVGSQMSVYVVILVGKSL